MAQSPTRLQGKHENLGFIPITHLCKMLYMVVDAWNGRTGVAETGGSPKLCLVSLAKSLSFQIHRETLAQKMQWRLIEMDN